ncbi:hypothetical protein [Streptomyces sp. NPDC020330]|uniref:hypothetical protein n=1 Tax=unclassified Streptomyces TaxID=2593676 RepID=UPI00378AE859
MKKFIAAGIALAASVSFLAVTPSQAAPVDEPVQAAAGDNRDNFILYANRNFDAAQKSFACRGAYYEDLTAPIENDASSMVNQAETGVNMYSGDNLTGTRYYAQPNSVDKDLGSFADTVESLKFADAQQC